jgi:hypothetical protein
MPEADWSERPNFMLDHSGSAVGYNTGFQKLQCPVDASPQSIDKIRKNWERGKSFSLGGTGRDVPLKENDPQKRCMVEVVGMPNREARVFSLAKDLPNIVDTIKTRNSGFLRPENLNKNLGFIIAEMSLEQLNSFSKNDLETHIENRLIEEEFLSPGFSIKMPCHEKTTINVRINSITRGFPRPIDFEE